MTVAKPDLIFREGSINDIDQVMKLGLLSYLHGGSVLTDENKEKLKSRFSEKTMWIELFDISRCFVCEIDGDIAGMAFFIPSGNPWEMFEANWAYLRMVGVAPQYQGLGIGQALTQQCIDHAKETGESIVALHTSEYMNAARHIYEKLGFTILKEIAPRMDKKYWVYTLNLNSKP